MRKFFLFLFATIILGFASVARDYSDVQATVANTGLNNRLSNSDVKIIFPKVMFTNMNSTIEIQIHPSAKNILEENDYKLMFIINDQNTLVTFNESGLGSFTKKFNSNENLQIYFQDFSYSEFVNIPSIAWVLAPVSLIIFLLGFRVVRSSNQLNTETIVKMKEKSNTIIEEPKLKIKTVKEMTEEVFS